MNRSLIACLLLLSAWPAPAGIDVADAIDVCREVADAAEEEGLPRSVVVSLAYSESKFDASAISPAGARGPLQVLPVWHCEEVRSCRRTVGRNCLRLVEDCDLIEAGTKALRAFLSPALRADDTRHRQTIWRDHKALSGFPRGAFEVALCKYTGCNVTKKTNTKSGSTAFVKSILSQAEWVQRGLDCRCSPPM